MNLKQWEALHKLCAPELEVSPTKVSDWLIKATADEVMVLIVVMKKAQTSEQHFQDYCDFLNVKLGGYTWLQ